MLFSDNASEPGPAAVLTECSLSDQVRICAGGGECRLFSASTEDVLTKHNPLFSPSSATRDHVLADSLQQKGDFYGRRAQATCLGSHSKVRL